MDSNDRMIVNATIEKIREKIKKLKTYRGWNGPQEIEKEFDEIGKLVDSIELFLVGEENEQESCEKDFLLPPRN